MSGQSSRPARVRSIAHGGSSKPAVMSVVTPPDSAAGHELGRDQVDVAVDGARRRDQAVAHDRRGVRADRQLDAVADPGLPARPTPTIRPSLMPMSALTTPMTGRRRAPRRSTASSSDGPTGRPWVEPRPERLGVAPDRLVAGRLAVLLDPDPQVGVAEADPVAGRRAEAGAPLRGERRLTSLTARPDRGRRSGSRRAPSARSSRPAGRGGSRRPPRDRTRAAG